MNKKEFSYKIGTYLIIKGTSTKHENEYTITYGIYTNRNNDIVFVGQYEDAEELNIATLLLHISVSFMIDLKEVSSQASSSVG